MSNYLHRGFETSELASRTARAQKIMHEMKLDAMFFTTEPNVRYFTGFQTQFWQSPTRPWFVVVPAEGKPIAIVPEIGASGMAQTWVDDIRSWPAPQPEDDGISLVAGVLNALPSRYGRVGATLGIESYLRMPVNNYLALTSLVNKEFVDSSLAVHELRQIKSQAEIERFGKSVGLPTWASTRFVTMPGSA